MEKLKKIFIAVFVLSLLITGCSKKSAYMDRPAEDGRYYYQNKDLGFKVTLPAEFIYYQTQRVATEDYIDIEFYIPTSDTEFVQSVPGYAQAFVVRVYKKAGWDKVNHNEATAIYKKFGTSGDYTLTYHLADNMPKDWQEKWTEDFKNSIKNNLSEN